MIESYYQDSNKKWKIVFLALLLILVMLFALSISIGSVKIPFSFLTDLVIGQSDHRIWENIVLNFRLPKALTAVLAGSALSLSGLQMQTLFRNPLAGPFILGISSGAGLGAALVLFLGVSSGGFIVLGLIERSWLLAICSALGSFLVLCFVLIISHRVRNSISLLLVGLMFGSIVSATVSILQYFSQAENIQAYVIWTFGSLGSISWTELSIIAPLILFGIATSLLLSKQLNALLLGENYAESMGIRIKRTRLFIILNTSLLAGTITAFCGPIAFIGLAIPHITRLFFNTGNHLLLTPLVVLVGSIGLLLFDLIAQLPGLDATLPLNAITSLFGAPFVIWLVLKRAKINYSF